MNWIEHITMIAGDINGQEDAKGVSYEKILAALVEAIDLFDAAEATIDPLEFGRIHSNAQGILRCLRLLGAKSDDVVNAMEALRKERESE